LNSSTEEFVKDVLANNSAASDKDIVLKAELLIAIVTQSRNACRMCDAAIDELRCATSDGLFANVSLAVADWTKLRKKRESLSQQMKIREAAVVEGRKQLEAFRARVQPTTES
jgi:hypothetical protein